MMATEPASDRPLPDRRGFSRLELAVLRPFARFWHGCHSSNPNPLPAEGPAILIANHPSLADPCFLLACSRRPIEFLHAKECYEVPILRPLFALAGCIPIARGRCDIAAIRRALRRLHEGAVLGMFPEGEISPGRQQTRPGKPGAALLALRSRAPVYPAWIAGSTRASTPLVAWLWPAGGVDVRFGPSVDLSGYYGRPLTAAFLREVTALFMARIAALGKG